MYLRELPESLLTNRLLSEFMRGSDLEPAESLVHLRKCIRMLPEYNFNLLNRLILHLAEVARHEEDNKMRPPNLAIVFTMSFLPENNVDQIKSMQNVVKLMILNWEELFEHLDSEGENDTTVISNGQLPIDGDDSKSSLEARAIDENSSHAAHSLNASDNARAVDSVDDGKVPLGRQQQPASGFGNSNRDSFTEVSAY
jgi:hypothetical protein